MSCEYFRPKTAYLIHSKCKFYNYVKMVSVTSGKRIGYTSVCACVWRPGEYNCPWKGFGENIISTVRTLEVL